MTFPDLDYIRNLVRIILPLVVVVAYIYLAATGNPLAEFLKEYAVLVITGYIGFDGLMRTAQRVNGNGKGKHV